jgi:hypothetical protein
VNVVVLDEWPTLWSSLPTRLPQVSAATMRAAAKKAKELRVPVGLRVEALTVAVKKEVGR